MAQGKKTVWKAFDYLHCDDFAAYLGDMAAKGWHFKEWGAGLVFERGEPRQETYAVEVFSEATEYDTRPEPRTEEFAEYCEAAGWVLVDAKRKFCIFRKVRPDAVEILTQEERLQNIAKEEKKEVWRQAGLCSWFFVLQLMQMTGSSFVNQIFSNASLMVFVVFCILFLGAWGRCIQFYHWRSVSNRKLQNGESLSFRKGTYLFSYLSGWYSMITTIALLVYVLCLCLLGQYFTLAFVGVLLGVIILISYLVAKFRPDAVTNQIIQTVTPMLIFIVLIMAAFALFLGKEEEKLPAEDIPLLYSDIGGEAGTLEDVTLDGSESIFGSALRCWLYYEEEHIYYQVFKSDHQWILDRIWNDEMDRKYNQNGTDCTAQWGAEAAVCTLPGYYRVRYDDGILYVNLPEDLVLTQSQIDIIRAALYESR